MWDTTATIEILVAIRGFQYRIDHFLERLLGVGWMTMVCGQARKLVNLMKDSK
jgi:hypothetical protein